MKTELKKVEEKFKPFEVVLTFETEEDVKEYYRQLKNCSGDTWDLYHLLENKLV